VNSDDETSFQRLVAGIQADTESDVDTAAAASNTQNVEVSSGKPMSIEIKTHAGKTITLDVDASDTIRNVKAKIQATEGIPPTLIRLSFAGKLLNDTMSLSHYKVKEHDTLNMFGAIAGGAKAAAAKRKRVSATDYVAKSSDPQEIQACMAWKFVPESWFSGLSLEKKQLYWQEIKNSNRSVEKIAVITIEHVGEWITLKVLRPNPTGAFFREIGSSGAPELPCSCSELRSSGAPELPCSRPQSKSMGAW
jgi:ubiquitin